MDSFFINKDNDFREKKVLIYNELRGYCSNPIELNAEVIKKWVNNYILPFLKAYDKIDDIIKGIERSITESENMEAERIKSIISRKHS